MAPIADDLAELTALQRRLLARPSTLTRPGGVVLYATCSPHLAETDVVVATADRLGGEVIPVGGAARTGAARRLGVRAVRAALARAA